MNIHAVEVCLVTRRAFRKYAYSTEVYNFTLITYFTESKERKTIWTLTVVTVLHFVLFHFTVYFYYGDRAQEL
jgi:hypothetical protein